MNAHASNAKKPNLLCFADSNAICCMYLQLRPKCAACVRAPMHMHACINPLQRTHIDPYVGVEFGSNIRARSDFPALTAFVSGANTGWRSMKAHVRAASVLCFACRLERVKCVATYIHMYIYTDRDVIA